MGVVPEEQGKKLRHFSIKKEPFVTCVCFIGLPAGIGFRGQWEHLIHRPGCHDQLLGSFPSSCPQPRQGRQRPQPALRQLHLVHQPLQPQQLQVRVGSQQRGFLSVILLLCSLGRGKPCLTFPVPLLRCRSSLGRLILGRA